MPSATSPSRPPSIRVVNELGQLQTLAQGRGQFRVLRPPRGGGLLLLGLGPDPSVPVALVEELDRELVRELGRSQLGEAGAGQVYYVEAPPLATQLPAAWHQAIPAHWRALSPEEAEALSSGPEPQTGVLLYQPGPRLFPSFWGPLVAALRLRELAPRLPQQARRCVLLPAAEQGLLTRELQAGFAAHGFGVRLLPLPESPGRHADALLEGVAAALDAERPLLYCSVNFQGLDPWGEVHALLRRAGVGVAVWCVDNPWHQLSALKAPFWRELLLLVTDHSFLPGLREHGARHVAHLPLAAWPEGFALADTEGPPLPPGLAESLLFVGRASFPHKNAFFAGSRIPPQLLAEALTLLEQGGRPDYHWWGARLEAGRLWPGNTARLPGYGAEECSQHLRLRCLRGAASLAPLQVYGDAQWPALLGADAGGATFHPPVDYYGTLPLLYRGARCTLNATSLLLPAGLTQRHFDVWTAGGFLLGDATPGLAIFPEELWRPVTVDGGWGRRSLAARLEALEREPGLRAQLSHAWRVLLLQEHDYAQRVGRVLALCGLD